MICNLLGQAAYTHLHAEPSLSADYPDDLLPQLYCYVREWCVTCTVLVVNAVLCSSIPRSPTWIKAPATTLCQFRVHLHQNKILASVADFAPHDLPSQRSSFSKKPLSNWPSTEDALTLSRYTSILCKQFLRNTVILS